MSIVLVPGQFRGEPHPVGKLASTLLSVAVAGMADDPRVEAESVDLRPGEVRRAGMLWRFCAEQTLTINTAAAGGNAELLAGGARRLDAAAAAA